MALSTPTQEMPVPVAQRTARVSNPNPQVELDDHYLVALAKEGRAEVVAVPIQQGNVQQLWEVTISRAADGQVLAQGRLRLQNVEPRA